jgi:hypothetical protein
MGGCLSAPSQPHTVIPVKKGIQMVQVRRLRNEYDERSGMRNQCISCTCCRLTNRRFLISSTVKAAALSFCELQEVRALCGIIYPWFCVSVTIREHSMGLIVRLLVEIAILLFPVVLFIRDEFFSDRRTRKHKRISRILYPTLIIGIIVTLLRSHQNEVKTDNFRDLLTDAIVKQELETENIERIISEKYRNVFDATDKEARKWAEDFARTLSEKRAALTDLSTKSKELRDKYYLRWHPLYEYALDSFDKRISELQRRDSGIDVIANDVPIVIADDFSNISETIRNVKFPNGNKISVRLHPGRIEHGLLIDKPNLIFGQTIEGQYSGSVFIIGFHNDQYELIIGHPVRYRNVLQEMKTREDPLLHVDFRCEIIKALNLTIESVYLHETGKSDH